MKFFCGKDNILDPLLKVTRAIAVRNPLPILSGILFELKDNTLNLTATNLEMGIKCTVQVNGEKDGNTVLPARQLVELVRRLPSTTALLETDYDTNATTIAYGESVARFHGFPSMEYPSLAFAEGYTFSLKGELLRNMLKQVLFAAGTDENRPIFTGVFLQIEDGEMTMVATDTHSLALRKQSLELEGSVRTKIVIPSKTLAELNKIIAPEEDITVTITENQIFFLTGDTTVMSRLIEGKFPDYKKVIPDNFRSTIKADSKGLLEALGRAYLLAVEGNQAVKLQPSDEKLIITADTELGSIREELEMELEGEAFDIFFNAKYLIDVINALNSESVLLNLTGPTSAGIVKSPDS
ncbi:MAG TPA: DNA polymerase III subunit beta, partial [Clostridia bacterium]|nr:DNA polymerase III subunit beta [Clostridia bacterium]